MVIRKPSSLKDLIIPFLMRSAALPDTSLKTARPSSLYRPMVFQSHRSGRWLKAKIPTSSHTSAPSPSEDLLNRAIRFANDHINIGDNEVAILQHSRKSLLFSNDEAWVKKVGPGLFDVAMGSFDYNPQNLKVHFVMKYRQHLAGRNPSAFPAVGLILKAMFAIQYWSFYIFKPILIIHELSHPVSNGGAMSQLMDFHLEWISQLSDYHLVFVELLLLIGPFMVALQLQIVFQQDSLSFAQLVTLRLDAHMNWRDNIGKIDAYCSFS